MKNIDYKQLRSYSNLPKYDPGMERIPSGYLGGNNFVLPSSVDNMGIPLDDDHNPSANLRDIVNSATSMMEFGKGLSNVYTAYKGLQAAKNTMNVAKAPAIPGSPVAAGTVSQVSQQTANQTVSGAASKLSAASAALRGVAAIQTVTGAIDSISAADKFGRSPYSANDYLGTSGSSTLYANGEAYKHLDGPNLALAESILRNFNNAGMTNSIKSGFKFGSGAGALVGSFFPGAGTLIGSGIGAFLGSLGGAITGLINKDKAEEKAREIQHNVNNAVEGWNFQSEAEAASRGIKNQYYNSHIASADTGLDLGSKKPNARVGALETIVRTDKKGDVTEAFTLPFIPGIHLPRRDDYLAHFDNGTGVFGFKYDEKTGRPFVEEGAILAQAFNSTDDPAEKKFIGDIMKHELKRLGKTPRNNPNPYELADKGRYMKNLKKYDLSDRYTGFDALRDAKWLNILPATLSSLASKSLYDKINRMDVIAPMANVQDNSAAIIDSMPTSLYIGDLLDTLNSLVRYALYNIKNAGDLTTGQKFAAMSNLFNNRAKAYSDIYAKKWEIENKLRSDKAQAKLNAHDRYSTRLQSASQEQINNYIRGNGAKWNNLVSAYRDIFKPWPTVAENQNNNNWMLANIGLSELKNVADMLKDKLSWDTINRVMSNQYYT